MPAANGVDGELGGVVIDADADATGIRAHVIDAVGNGFAEFLVDEVMYVDLVGAPLGPIVAPRVLVWADQFLLLGVDRDHRLAGGLKSRDLRVDMLELSVPVEMTAAFQALAVDLTAVAETIEQLRNPARRNTMPHVAQRERELRMALGHPQQRPHRVAERRGFEQAPQVFQERRIGLRERGRPPPERRTFDGAGSSASKSFRPRLIVLRATPVARATTLTPPYPAERASAAANNRRSRSSRRERIAS